MPSSRPAWSRAAATWLSAWVSTPRATSAAGSGRVGRATVFLLAGGVGGTHQPDDGQHCDGACGQALIRSLRRTGGAEDTRPARPTDPMQGTRPVDPRVRPAERAPRPSSSQWIQAWTGRLDTPKAPRTPRILPEFLPAAVQLLQTV